MYVINSNSFVLLWFLGLMFVYKDLFACDFSRIWLSVCNIKIGIFNLWIFYNFFQTWKDKEEGEENMTRD